MRRIYEGSAHVLYQSNIIDGRLFLCLFGGPCEWGEQGEGGDGEWREENNRRDQKGDTRIGSKTYLLQDCSCTSSSPRVIADDLDHTQIAVIAAVPFRLRSRVVRWFGHGLIDLNALFE
jgi:hypothetical protein